MESFSPTRGSLQLQGDDFGRHTTRSHNRTTVGHFPKLDLHKLYVGEMTSSADMTDRRVVSSQTEWVRSRAAARVFCCALQTPGVTVVLSLLTVTCMFSKWACRKIGRQGFDAPFPWRATSVCDMCLSHHDTAPGLQTLETLGEKWPKKQAKKHMPKKQTSKKRHEYSWPKFSFFVLHVYATCNMLNVCSPETGYRIQESH